MKPLKEKISITIDGDILQHHHIIIINLKVVFSLHQILLV